MPYDVVAEVNVARRMRGEIRSGEPESLDVTRSRRADGLRFIGLEIENSAAALAYLLSPDLKNFVP